MFELTAACCTLALFAGTALAGEYEKRTAITLNEPVIVAGVPVVTLEPGKYVIRLMNHDHNRNIVQFFNEREDRLYTTVLAIPNYRLEAQGKTIFRFWETPVGNPIAIRSWFAAGDNWGQEFVYPEGLAAKIARDTGEPVLVSKAETVAELETAPVTEVNKAGEEQPLEEAFVAPEPDPAPVEIAQAVAPDTGEAPFEVPATASPFFTFGLLGIATAAAGLGLRLGVNRL